MRILHPKLRSLLCGILFSFPILHPYPILANPASPSAVKSHIPLTFSKLYFNYTFVKSQILGIVHHWHPDPLFSVNIFCSLRTKFLHFYWRWDCHLHVVIEALQWSSHLQNATCMVQIFLRPWALVLPLASNLWSFALQASTLPFCHSLAVTGL